MQQYLWNFRQFSTIEDGTYGNCNGCRRFEKDCPHMQKFQRIFIDSNADVNLKYKSTCDAWKQRIVR